MRTELGSDIEGHHRRRRPRIGLAVVKEHYSGGCRRADDLCEQFRTESANPAAGVDHQRRRAHGCCAHAAVLREQGADACQVLRRLVGGSHLPEKATAEQAVARGLALGGTRAFGIISSARLEIGWAKRRHTDLVQRDQRWWRVL